MRVIAQAMRHGYVGRCNLRRDVFRPVVSGADPRDRRHEEQVRADGLPMTERACALKMLGFTDARLAHSDRTRRSNVRQARQNLGVTPVFKRIDTCAAEFEAQTPYMYSTYEAPVMGEAEDESAALRRQERSSSSAVARTGSARASSSIIAAATPAFALTERGL